MRKLQRGQSSVEFGLAAVVLLLLAGLSILVGNFFIRRIVNFRV